MCIKVLVDVHQKDHVVLFRDEGERGNPAAFTAVQRSLLLLTAQTKVEIHSRKRDRRCPPGECSNGDAQITQHPAKRRRIESGTPLSSMLDQAFLRPALWFPVLATVVVEHAHALTDDVVASWISSSACAMTGTQSLNTASRAGTAPVSASPLEATRPDGTPDHVGATWFLRCIAELAGVDGADALAAGAQLRKKNASWQVGLPRIRALAPHPSVITARGLEALQHLPAWRVWATQTDQFLHPSRRFRFKALLICK